MGEDREEGARGLTPSAAASRAPVSPLVRLRLWAPVVAMMGVQFFLSAQVRLPALLPVVPFGDKLQHAAWFFLLGLLACRAAREGEGWARARTAAVVLLGALAWGASDEIHQSFVPGRAVEAADLVADVTGAGLAVLLSERLLRRLGLLAGTP